MAARASLRLKDGCSAPLRLKIAPLLHLDPPLLLFGLLLCLQLGLDRLLELCELLQLFLHFSYVFAEFVSLLLKVLLVLGSLHYLLRILRRYGLEAGTCTLSVIIDQLSRVLDPLLALYQQDIAQCALQLSLRLLQLFSACILYALDCLVQSDLLSKIGALNNGLLLHHLRLFGPCRLPRSLLFLAITGPTFLARLVMVAGLASRFTGHIVQVIIALTQVLPRVEAVQYLRLGLLLRQVIMVLAQV